MEEDTSASVPVQIQNWLSRMKDLEASFQFDQNEDDLEEVWITDHFNNQDQNTIVEATVNRKLLENKVLRNDVKAEGS